MIFQKYINQPKKYFTLIGSLLFFIQCGTIALTASASPYYMSYLHIMLHSKIARYPNTIYILAIQLISLALGGAIVGVLINLYNIKAKLIGTIGSLVIGLVFNNTFIFDEI